MKKILNAIAVFTVVMSVLFFAGCPANVEQKYTVSFDANGATGTVPESQSVEENTEINLSEVSGSTLTKEGYLFEGWSLTGEEDSAIEKTEAIKADTVLKAVWSAIWEEYTVSPSENKLREAESDTETECLIVIRDIYKSSGAKLSKLPVELVVPTTFNGKTVTGLGANACSNIPDVTSITIPSTVVKFGASAISNCLSLTKVIIEATEISVENIAEGAFAVNENCTFFLTNVSVKNVINSKDTSINTEVTSYKVTFITGDDDSIFAERTVECGSVVILPSEPEKENKVFDAWYVDKLFETKFDVTTIITTDITLYAKFNDCEASYTITFVTGEGASTIDPITVAYKTYATKPANPVKEGYDFAGWYTDDTYTTVFDFYKTITKNYTLYAKWNLIVSSAKFANTDYTAYVGYEITTLKMTISLTNTTFKSIAVDTDVSSWFTNLPTGLSVKVKTAVVEGGTSIDLGLTGTPTVESKYSEYVTTIPADCLVSGVALTVDSSLAHITVSVPVVKFGEAHITGVVGNEYHCLSRATIVYSSDSNYTFNNVAVGDRITDWFTMESFMSNLVIKVVEISSDKKTLTFRIYCITGKNAKYKETNVGVYPFKCRTPDGLTVPKNDNACFQVISSTVTTDEQLSYVVEAQASVFTIAGNVKLEGKSIKNIEDIITLKITLNKDACLTIGDGATLTYIEGQILGVNSESPGIIEATGTGKVTCTFDTSTAKIYTTFGFIKYISEQVYKNDDDMGNITSAKLMNDITFSSNTNATKASNTITASSYLSYIFDGNLRKLIGLKFSNSSLFSCIKSSGGVKKLTLENVSGTFVSSSSSSFGFITGSMYDSSTITNCSVSGSLTANVKGSFGVIAGCVVDKAVVNNCTNNISLTKCSYVPAKTVTSGFGGIVGNLYDKAQINNCKNNTNFEFNEATNVGGICGIQSGENKPTISSCINNGNITADIGNNIGGLVGYRNSGTTGQTNKGTITGNGKATTLDTGTSSNSYIGKLIGKDSSN